jgi:hypothetical protein
MGKSKRKKREKPTIPSDAEEILEEVIEALEPKVVKGIIGRPVAISSVSEMEDRIIEYLNSLSRWGLPTKAGLAFALGVHRDTLNKYEKEAGFSDILKHWYQFFEDRWVQNLARPNATGTIFYLKNTYGYVDAYDQNNTNKVVHYVIPREIADKHAVRIEAPAQPVESAAPVQVTEHVATAPETEGSGG